MAFLIPATKPCRFTVTRDFVSGGFTAILELRGSLATDYDIDAGAIKTALEEAFPRYDLGVHLSNQQNDLYVRLNLDVRPRESLCDEALAHIRKVFDDLAEQIAAEARGRLKY